jgi:hypothetical protein
MDAFALLALSPVFVAKQLLVLLMELTESRFCFSAT